MALYILRYFCEDGSFSDLTRLDATDVEDALVWSRSHMREPFATLEIHREDQLEWAGMRWTSLDDGKERAKVAKAG
jgi:hypothetical protein